MKHTLIVGGRGVGKSTLVDKLLRELDRPVYGFRSRKETTLGTPEQGDPVYLYDLREEEKQTEENRVAWCHERGFTADAAVFERFAPRLRQPVPEEGLILMDEIGFMESKAQDFCAAVLDRLAGDIPVLAVVKDKNTAFLNTVRSHPKARCFYITEENREELYPEVLAFLKEQLK